MRASSAALIGLLVLVVSSPAEGDSVAQVQTAKRISSETVALIDPESGTSTGGSTTDVRYAVGDILTFTMQFTPVPNGSVRGLGGYVTEYIPPNTEVVGVRIIDSAGNTIFPRRGGFAQDGWGQRGANDYSAYSLPQGSMSQLYADTGIFYSTDPRTVRTPNDRFITVFNGIAMNPTPTGADQLAGRLGIPRGGPYYAHNSWDWIQAMAFGTGGGGGVGPPVGGDINTRGQGNTPYLYGSAVAGPGTFYPFEATQTAPDTIVANGTTGPWHRIRYAGSEIGVGSAATSAGIATRVGVPYTGGFDVTVDNPLPRGTNAVRFAVGELVVGEEYVAEISLRVLGSPLDPVLGDVNCAEVFGGDASARSPTRGGKDNTWRYFVPSPACVQLNLFFELSVDRLIADVGDIVTYTLTGRNLSTLPRTNVVVTDTFDPAVLTLLSATGGPTVAGGTLTWPTIPTWAPAATFTQTLTFRVTGTGTGSTLNRATFTSTDIPGGFSTVALVNLGQRALIRLDMAATPATVMPGGRFRYSATIRNDGNGNATANEYIVELPPGFTIVPGTSTIGGAAVADPTGTGPYSYTAGLVDLGPGASTVLAFDVDVATTVTTGVYTSCLETWHRDVGFGRDVNDAACLLGPVSVGAPRSASPVISGPIGAGTTCVSGTTTEADGTTITVYVNGLPRGTTTSAGGAWTVCGIPTLYGGQRVTATATAAGELESPQSSPPEVVSPFPTCSDGVDNDGDGLIDFPADPGCSSPTDGDESNTECSDGIDNDGDGDIDFPADLECGSPDDLTEGGPPACNDMADNDGDGLVDFPADPDCTSLTDRTEVTLRRCMNHIDDDGDGLVDFPADPGCHSPNDDDEVDFAYPPADVRPRILFVFDTSGSMNWQTCANEFTGGDGSASCPGTDVTCASCSTTPGCGNGVADDSRIFQARAGLTSVVAGFGEVEYGLMRFHQRARAFGCPGTNASLGSGGWQGAGATPCGGGFSGADLLVGFSPENEYDLLEWMDNDTNYPGMGEPPPGLDFELRGTGTTPIAGALADAQTYLTGVRTADGTVGTCRPYRVILITDGAETCGGDPVAAAGALSAAGFPTNVIGFATPDPAVRANLHAIAAAGGTGTAIFADDATTLSAAISEIVNSSILREVCNGIDDNCNGLVDEGFTLYCNWDGTGPSPTPSLCTDPGETLCDGLDNNCDGRVDEGLLNACGFCGPVPVEICNGIDDDCDGPIDEGGVCAGCVPEPERCDGMDNDCDGLIDEGLSRPCGTDVGVCTVGAQTCTAGAWGACSGVGPSTEICDGLDNDCDGVIDGITRPCGSSVGACSPGTETCVMGSFTGVCVGATGPSPEICDGVDNNCDGVVDEGNPGGGAACGSAIGACSPGTITCVGGVLTCVGGVSPSPETCNGVDDDCNGVADDGVPTGPACGTCGDGLMRCVSGAMVCTGDRTPTAEVCNGIDDNCDGTVDEGDPGGGGTCGSTVGECTAGTLHCTGGLLVCTGGTSPAAEVCDGLDNDCDGLVDEGNPGGGASCGATDVGECDFGALTCVSGSLVCVGETGPSPEACDGLDNDCDGMVDEGNPGGGAVCGDSTGECSTGTLTCVSGALTCVGAVGPSPEVCDGLDNDCDGVVDDGLDVGAPCGSDVGECVPGILRCRGGMVVCDGAIGPTPEVCNALDDDCDGMVDNSLPLGGTCGMSEGACVPGMTMCVDGFEVCVGEVPSGPEVCDCEDNDCDGMVDEGELCPGGARCIDCSCALPCMDTEFGRCPSGRVPQTDMATGECFCVAQLCDPDTCPTQTVEVDGEVRCAPDTPGLPACSCRMNRCTFPCDGVVCTAPTVCEPSSGTCVEDNCRGLGCADGQICDLSTLTCVDDPCAAAGCAADQACRNGTCETSCAVVSCPAGQACRAGSCVDDPCDGVSCPAAEVCDPSDGSCVPDMCGGVMCPAGSVCDPVTGNCPPDPCTFLRCPEGQSCRKGECALDVAPRPDAGTPPDGGGLDAGVEMDAGAGVEDPEDRILASGGGCSCDAASSGRSPGGPLLLLAALSMVLWRRRRRG